MTASPLREGPVREEVVLLDDDGPRPPAPPTRPPCTARPRPLHLAFSCYGFDRAAGRLLVTRRARRKAAYPLGVRTGTCCGHPAPGEDGWRTPSAGGCADELGLRSPST